jgi:hypothetical protein
MTVVEFVLVALLYFTLLCFALRWETLSIALLKPRIHWAGVWLDYRYQHECHD